ncbi:hypothetical protein, partial [Pseudomonas lundensis]|uniref:hypothetical protein n=1 Tax=Pseudomonas lundensis TaxID=86185 RepID=UPI001C528A52
VAVLAMVHLVAVYRLTGCPLVLGKIKASDSGRYGPSQQSVSSSNNASYVQKAPTLKPSVGAFFASTGRQSWGYWSTSMVLSGFIVIAMFGRT